MRESKPTPVYNTNTLADVLACLLFMALFAAAMWSGIDLWLMLEPFRAALNGDGHG